MKLSYEDVKAINPKIIYCGIVGFGQNGPLSQQARLRFDHPGRRRYRGAPSPRNAASRVRADRDGGQDHRPYRDADGADGALSSRAHRRRPVDRGADVREHRALRARRAHVPSDIRSADRHDRRSAHLRSWARPVPTRDGWICISANTNAQAFAVFDAIGKPEFKTDPRFSSVAARFKQRAGIFFGARGRPQAENDRRVGSKFSTELDVPAMHYHTLETLMEDPHLNDVGFFQKFDHPTEGTHDRHGAAQPVDRGCARGFHAGAESRPAHRRDPARSAVTATQRSMQ